MGGGGVKSTINTRQSSSTNQDSSAVINRIHMLHILMNVYCNSKMLPEEKLDGKQT